MEKLWTLIVQKLPRKEEYGQTVINIVWGHTKVITFIDWLE